ncbi:MAG: four helix bundle protein, partial [Candidatus Thermoplasmatota archaeon]
LPMAAMKPLEERFLTYRRSLEMVVACEEVARHLPAFRRDLIDQLRRASSSVSLNIAEGAEEFSPKEKLRIYRIARRSAQESIAILDVADRVIPAGPDTLRARNLLNEVLGLLTNTSIALESRK